MTCLDGTDWDKPVSEDAALMCHELAEKLQECDPVTGLWRADTSSAVAWRLWCDASDLAYGMALESDGSIIEDGCWPRPPEDKRHINSAELEAVIKGLSLAAKWDATNVQLMTDSKTVAGWLKQITDNVRRMKTKGLHDMLVQRHLQLIDDLVVTAGMTVQVQWIRSSENKADELTHVPLEWVKRFKARYDADIACDSRQCVVGPGNVSFEQFARAQEEHSCHRFVYNPSENPCQPDDPVQLLCPDRRQKYSEPYEPGWQVVDVIAPSTVRIRHSIDDHVQENVVNVDLLKADTLTDVSSSGADPGVQSYNLRSQSTLQRPERYS